MEHGILFGNTVLRYEDADEHHALVRAPVPSVRR